MKDAEIRTKVETLRGLWTKGADHGAFYDALILSAIASDRRFGAPSKPKDVTRTPDDLLELPRWVVEECMDRVKAGLRVLATGKGRKARWIERYKQDRIDAQRWDTVDSLHHDRGATWEDVFGLASLELRGTFAAGSASAMRHSWDRVRIAGPLTYEAYFLQLPLGPREIV